MNQFPESARRRMQSQDPGLAKTGLDRGTLGEHPDADLLTAFAEQALGGTERERVLLHLAACATCRDVVSLAAPEPHAPVEVAAPVAESWFRWPVLRWTAVAATVIVVGAAVSVLVERNRNVEVEVPAAQTAAETKAAEPAAKEGVAANKEHQVPAAKKPAGEVEKKRRTEMAAASNQPKLQDAPPAEDRRDVAEAAAARVAKPAESETVKLKALDNESAKKEMARKDTAVVVTGQNAVVGGTIAKSDSAVYADKVAPAAPPPPPPAQAEATSAMRARAGAVGGIMGAAPMVLSKSRTDDNTRWHVTSSGAVERSNDGARWETVDVDPGVKFRAISSNNGDLWVGGTNGALFHSADAGRSWSRVKVGIEGMWVSDTITSVSFTSARSGFVMTESRVVWTTQDSGQTWQRR